TSSRWLRPPVLIAGGTTAALFLGSLIVGAMAVSSQNDFDDAVTQSQDESLPEAERQRARTTGLSAADTAETRALVSDLLLVGAAVGAGFTIYFVLDDPDDDES